MYFSCCGSFIVNIYGSYVTCGMKNLLNPYNKDWMCLRCQIFAARGSK